jgi:hypothetical protein
MSMRSLAAYSIAAAAGGAMLTLSMTPASALTLSSPSLEKSVASSQIDNVWYRCGYGRCGYGYGYHGAYRGGYYGRGAYYGRGYWRHGVWIRL